jgi:hypothetical protein
MASIGRNGQTNPLGQESTNQPIEATPYNIHISALDTPGYTHVDELKQESADMTSELLMVNHAKFHTLFDFVGFHSKSRLLAEDRQVQHPLSKSC